MSRWLQLTGVVFFVVLAMGFDCAGAARLAILTHTLPECVKGKPYNAVLVATGGKPPYHWSMASGALPSGITLSSTGVISGTSSALGTKKFTVKVKDSSGTTATSSN